MTANSRRSSPPATATSTSPGATTSRCGQLSAAADESGLLRPPPNKVKPPVSRAHLERQLAAGVSRAEIATAHRVGLSTVTRWCAHYDLEVVGPARPAGGRGVELDPHELRRLYVAEQWTARQIAAEFASTRR